MYNFCIRSITFTPLNVRANVIVSIQVKCSIRVRHLERSTPGHHNYSENFKAGMFVSKDY